MEISLQVEGFTNAAGRPQRAVSSTPPKPERLVGESDQEYTFRCVRNMRSAAHSPTQAGPEPYPQLSNLSSDPNQVSAQSA